MAKKLAKARPRLLVATAEDGTEKKIACTDAAQVRVSETEVAAILADCYDEDAHALRVVVFEPPP